MCMKDSLRSFMADKSGATAIEYALAASLIAVALIVAISNMSTAISGEFSEVSSALK